MDSVDAVSKLPDEDDSLDDFFAKKDKAKKGKKKKSKYITTESLAKTLEKINTRTEEEEQQQQQQQQQNKTARKDKESGTGEKGVNAADAEEWHEFEDESQRDYSDLKIQNFQISDQKQEEIPEPQYNDQGELILPKEEEGPWKKQTKDKPTNPLPSKVPEPTVSEPVPTVKSVYRPPHARQPASTASSGILPGQGRRRRPQEAPVINSEIDFPSLATAVQDTEQHVGFETVKSGARSISRTQQQQQQNSSKGNALTLGNQFEALRD